MARAVELQRLKLRQQTTAT